MREFVQARKNRIFSKYMGSSITELPIFRKKKINRNLKGESIMSIVVNIYYSGENGSARKFAKEMISSGTVDAIRNEEGNIRYDYFFSLGDEETVLLIDSWENQESIDFHHQSPMMNKIAELRDKYNLHMKVERYRSEDTIPDTDQKYIRN